MSRCTRYNEKLKQYIRLSSRLAVDNKLGKLEDLEEELGCPLGVIVRSVRDGIYGFHKIYDGARVEEIEVFEHFEVSFDGYSLWNETNYEYNYDELFKVSPILNEINLSDYKKTWWLKDDRSE